MKTFPDTAASWMRLFTLPFKISVLAYGIIYPVWLYSAPGVPGTKGGPDYSFLERLALVYAFVAVVLLMLAVVQAGNTDRRGALWSVVFSVIAVVLAANGIFHLHWK